MAYTLPQVLVFQEFEQVPAELTEPLRAHISGGHAHLRRYSVADEKLLIALGAYDPDDAAAYAWPGRPAGAVVDQDYTKLFIDNALLEYFTDLIGEVDDFSEKTTVVPVSGHNNRVRSMGTRGFRTNGADYPRFSSLYDRDVKAGDIVSLRGVVDDEEYTLDTYVVDVKGETVAATVGEAYSDDNNGATQSNAATVEQTAGRVNCIQLEANLSQYDGRPDGYINDVYTIEVISGSIAGDLSVARVRVTSASGLDDEASVEVADANTLFAVGDRGLRLRFVLSSESSCSASEADTADDLLVGQKWEVDVTGANEPATPLAGGTYTGETDTVYIVEVVRGGAFSDTLKPQIRVTTNTGVDASGPTTVTGDDTEVAVGSKGVTIAFYGSGGSLSLSGGDVVSFDELTGLRKGDIFYIEVTAAAVGRMSTLVLGHSLPIGMRDAEDLDLRLSIKKNIQVDKNREGFEPLTNWETSATEFTVNDGIVAYDTSWTDSGEALPIEVRGGSLYVEYRAWLPALADSVHTISDVGELDDLISGATHPDNPLKWGVFKALSNSNGTAVKFTAVAEPDDLDSWLEVIELLVGRRDVYGLVPLTRDQDVLDAFVAHAGTQSGAEAGRWRVVWVNLEGKSQDVVVDASTSTDGEEVLATLADDPNTSGTQYTLLVNPDGNGNFLTNGVRAGDIVRYLYETVFGEQTYTEFVVDAVLSEDTIRLAAGHSVSVNVARKIEIWHPLTKTEMAADIAAQAAAYGSNRVRAVWPDLAGSGGSSYPGYFLCAALAGLRSGVVPHQPLTNVELSGFDDVTRASDLFNSAQLNVMAEAGTWIVTKTVDGSVVTRHALTTDTTDVNTREEMVVSNVDSISYVALTRFEPFIGKMNVTPTAVSALRVELESIIGFLKANGNTERLGSQLVDGTIVELRRHALLRDRVVAVVDVELPYPLNNVELHLVV